jgi:hypothetical protein
MGNQCPMARRPGLALLARVKTNTAARAAAYSRIAAIINENADETRPAPDSNIMAECAGNALHCKVNACHRLNGDFFMNAFAYLLADDSLWARMFHPDIPIVEKILRPIIIYVFLLIGLRLAGKRELAQLTRST